MAIRIQDPVSSLTHTINTKGTPPAAVLKELKAIQRGMKPKLEKLAQSYSRGIAFVINTNRKRAGQYDRDSLANAFKPGMLTMTKTGFSIGIGEMSYLDEHYPYWYIINVGGYIPPTTVGWFGHHGRPEAGGGGETFHYRPYVKGNFKMIPKNPITGMHYLEKTHNMYKKRWKAQWSSYFKKRRLKK